jgi:hypothetical protein
MAPAPSQASLPVGARALCLALAAGCMGVLAIGWSLTPDARGVGTHQALGLPACGWLLGTGWPCPTCGMTTSVSLAAHGRLLDSARVQPLGLVLAVSLATAFWPLAFSGLTGSKTALMLTKLLQPVVLWAGLALVLAAWGYKAGIMRWA